MIPPNFSNIPQELKDRPQWVCWKKVVRDGKETKIPVNPHTGGQAAVDKPATHAPYDMALAAANNNGNAGIGFVFTTNDPFTGIDIDHCIENGEIHPQAIEVLELLNSYSEKTQSDLGLHIIIKGKLPHGGRRKGKLEMYDSGRFFVMTGAHLDGTPTSIENRQAELEGFHARVFGKPQAPPKPADHSPALTMADSEIIEKARSARNGAKFDLLCRGDWQGAGFPSQSEADLAFCSMMAFYTQDPEQIDRIHRASGLYRQKWDSRRGDSTYGAKCIDKALAGVTETYKPPRSAPEVGRTKTEATGHPQQTEKPGPEQAAPKPQAPPPSLRFPGEVMAGAAGNFSRVYSEYLETPASFLYMDYLTVLGHVISDQLTLKSEISPQPRLYTVNLGESADARKSTAQHKTTSHFNSTLTADAVHEVLGVGSAEGLQKAFKRNNRVLLVVDELNALIQKMRIDASVLSPCICTLFESNRFHSLTKKHEITIDSAELCILAACTLDTYRSMFTSQFLDIGMLNRFFVVIGDSERKFSIPQMIPDEEKEALKKDLVEVLSFVDSLSQGARYAMPINSTAREIFDAWYFDLESSVFTKRLDTYGHRLMPLLAVNEKLDIITPEIAEKTIALLNYQLAARKFADPIDADNAVAKLEERIRRALADGPLSRRELGRKVNKQRMGNSIWNLAIRNLSSEGEIIFDSKQKVFRING
jgi:hypothetical protein